MATDNFDFEDDAADLAELRHREETRKEIKGDKDYDTLKDSEWDPVWTGIHSVGKRPEGTV